MPRLSAPSPRNSQPPRPRSIAICRRWCNKASSTRTSAPAITRSGIKLVVLGEAARGRFDIVRAARDELIALRDGTQQAATVCGMVQDSLVVLDLIQGHTVIEFGTRPGTRLALDASAHGKVWLAFSSGAPIERALARGPAGAEDRRPSCRKSRRFAAAAGRRPRARSSRASMRSRRRCSIIPRAWSGRLPSSARPSSSRRSRAEPRSKPWSARHSAQGASLRARSDRAKRTRLSHELFAGGGYRRHVHGHRAAACVRPVDRRQDADHARTTSSRDSSPAFTPCSRPRAGAARDRRGRRPRHHGGHQRADRTQGACRPRCSSHKDFATSCASATSIVTRCTTRRSSFRSRWCRRN